MFLERVLRYSLLKYIELSPHKFENRKQIIEYLDKKGVRHKVTSNISFFGPPNVAEMTAQAYINERSNRAYNVSNNSATTVK